MEPFTLKFGRYGLALSQLYRSCGESTTKHRFVPDPTLASKPEPVPTEFPMLTPPDTFAPRGSRACSVTSTPLKTSEYFPNFDASLSTLSIRPNFSGLMSYRPHTCLPLTLPNRESAGAVTQYGSKSAGVTRMLSLTV